MRAAVEAIEAEHGAVGALVNNAGYSQSGAVESVPMDDVRRQFETNVFGLVRHVPARAARDARAARGADREHQLDGRELHVPGRRLYHATKYAVDAISDALRFEVKGFGVDVVIIQPGHDQDRVRRAADARDPGRAAGGRSLRDVQRRGRQGDERAPTRRARWRSSAAGPTTVAKDDRAGDHDAVAQDPLPRHAVGAHCSSTSAS